MKHLVVEVRPGEKNQIVAEYSSYEEARKEAARCNIYGDFSYYVEEKQKWLELNTY